MQMDKRSLRYSSICDTTPKNALKLVGGLQSHLMCRNFETLPGEESTWLVVGTVHGYVALHIKYGVLTL